MIDINQGIMINAGKVHIPLINSHKSESVIIAHKGVGTVMQRDPDRGTLALLEAYSVIYKKISEEPFFEQHHAGPLGWHTFVVSALENSTLLAATSQGCYCSESAGICNVCVNDANESEYLYNLVYDFAIGIIPEVKQAGGYFNGGPFFVNIFDRDTVEVGYASS